MNKNYCTIYLVRHGESRGNVNLAHWINEVQKTELGSDLTENGKEQARLLSKKLGWIKFDAILSSHLLRAKSTAEIFSEDRKMEVITKGALEERRKGKLGGKSKEELEKEFDNKFLYGNANELSEAEMWKFRLYEDMESAEEAVTRLINVLREIAIAYAGKTVLVVSHGNVMRTLLIKLELGNFKELPGGAIVNTGYLVLESDGVDFFVKEMVGVNKNT